MVRGPALLIWIASCPVPVPEACSPVLRPPLWKAGSVAETVRETGPWVVTWPVIVIGVLSAGEVLDAVSAEMSADAG
jgi:hypothetical protein